MTTLNKGGVSSRGRFVENSPVMWDAYFELVLVIRWTLIRGFTLSGYCKNGIRRWLLRKNATRIASILIIFKLRRSYSASYFP